MKNKSLKILLIATVLVIGFYLYYQYEIEITTKDNYRGNQEQQVAKKNIKLSGEEPLIDKVFTFLTPSDTLTFEELNLNKDFMYNFFFEIVTPHNCTMKVDLHDPNQKLYELSVLELNYYKTIKKSVDIPFGSAMTGDYKLTLETDSVDNVNIHVKITQELHCLEDKIPNFDIENFISYKVSRVENNKDMIWEIPLLSDLSYKIYIGRVSTIAYENQGNIKLNFSITDLLDRKFIIFRSKVMEDFNNIESFDFGTAMSGNYTITQILSFSASNINIGTVIMEDRVVSDQINETSDHDEETTTSTNNSGGNDVLESILNYTLSIPIEYEIGTGIIGGTVVGSSLMLYTQEKKKRNIPIKRKK